MRCLFHPYAQLLVLPLVLAAAVVAPPADAQKLRPATWDARLDELSRLLSVEDYPAAYDLAQPLADELAQGVGQGQAADQVMARVVASLALAEAGLGREEDALWHWSWAVSVLPDLASTPFERHGAAGEVLERLREEWETPEEEATEEPEGLESPDVKGRAPQPHGTAGMRAGASDEKVVISVLIGVDGTVRQPRILVHEWPGYAFVAAETVRDWPFEPARLDEEPVETYYNLEVNWLHR